MYHIETSPLICRANEWTGFYMKGASVMKRANELIVLSYLIFTCSELTIETLEKGVKCIKS